MIDCTRLKTFSAWLPMLVLAASLACPCAARAEDAAWRVGLARARITPERPMPICGYGSRGHEGPLGVLRVENAQGNSGRELLGRLTDDQDLIQRA